MIIDRNASVAPPRYPDREVRKIIGDAIGKANKDDLLAAFLWVQEIKIGGEACTAIRSHKDGLREYLEIIRRHKKSSTPGGRTWEFTQAEVDSLFDAFIKAVNDELDLVERLSKEAGQVFEELRTIPEENLATCYAPGRSESPLNIIVEHWDEMIASEERFTTMDDHLFKELERLAMIDGRRRIFSQSKESYSLGRIQSFSSKTFEEFVAWLTQRDGMKLRQPHGGAGDRGADVISQTPDGRRVVIQCKQTSRATKHSVDSTKVQTFNGTARPLHKADIAVMVTNGTFSQPARELANYFGIHLISATELERWATWGDSLYEVIGIPAESTAEVPA